MINFLINKTLIIGLGLIGGSIAKNLKSHNISNEIWAFDLDYDSIENAKKQGVINGIHLLEDKLFDFDLIILSTPLSQYQNIFNKLHQKINPKAIFFDIGSIKNFTFKNIPSNFIPCHPIAGSEKGGYENSDANLFANKNFIICQKFDNFNNSPFAKIVQSLNAKPSFLDPKIHDKIYGLVSHLPQFLSFLCAEFQPKDLPNQFMQNAFRLHKSSPQIWQDIFELNHNNLEFFYNKFYENLDFIIHNKNIFATIEGLNYKSFMTNNSSNSNFDNNFLSYFEKNFSKIFFRILVIISFLEIEEISSYQPYAGKGFHDFISLINLLNFDLTSLNTLITKNQSSIINLFKNISN